MTYGWWTPIQQQASSQLLAAAQPAGAVSEVVLDLSNKSVRIAVPAGTSPTQKQAVRSAVLATQLGQTLSSKGWSVPVDSLHDRPYTSHIL